MAQSRSCSEGLSGRSLPTVLCSLDESLVRLQNTTQAARKQSRPSLSLQLPCFGCWCPYHMHSYKLPQRDDLKRAQWLQKSCADPQRQACLLKKSHFLSSIYKQAFLCKNQKGFFSFFFFYTGKQSITSCYLILREEKRKKLTFVDVSFNNSYCFVNNLNCSIFVFLLGAQCYDKFGDSYKIFYSNQENKLVFFHTT